MKKPNFFIIGAPKCGTTSLASWLSEHPNVYMSSVKEPDYFYTTEKIKSLKEYEDLFKKVESKHVAVGEASVRYVYSQEAIASILKYTNKKAKFILMLRNPIEMAHSLHAQRVYSLNENVANFEKAWFLQNEDETHRKDLPKNCYTPELNNYGPICKLGEKLEKILEIISPNQCKFILLEDLSSNPRKIWIELMEFLEIEDDGRNEFSARNKSKKARSQVIQKLLRKLGSMKRDLGIERSIGLLDPLVQWNRIEKPRPPLSDSMRDELRVYFKDDIRKLESILNRDLSYWE